MKRLFKSMGAFAAGAVALVAVMLGSITPASASAYGIDRFSAVTIGGFDIPTGIFEHSINGNGLSVAWEWAEFETVTNGVCNWRIDFRYYTTSNSVYKTLPGGYHSGCQRVGSRTVYPGNLREGRACARLLVSGVLLSQQCHYISR